MKFRMLMALLAAPLFLLAQPETEVFVFDLDMEAKSITNPINISNNPGYDNQPSFVTDSTLVFAYSVHGQPDVLFYELTSGYSIRLTDTPGGEYSPTPTPDGSSFSFIRLDPDGKQLLYKLGKDKKAEPLHNTLVIGYHAWIDKDELLAFVLGEPSTLVKVNTTDGSHKTLDSNIGRSLHKHPKSGKMLYISKAQSDWTINSWDPKSGTIETVTKTLPGQEDFCIHPNGILLMGKADQLFYFQHDQWKPLANVSAFGIKNISRLAVSPNGKRLALVGELR